MRERKKEGERRDKKDDVFFFVLLVFFFHLFLIFIFFVLSESFEGETFSLSRAREIRLLFVHPGRGWEVGVGEERSTLLRGGRTLEEKRGEETGSRWCKAEVEVEKKIFLRQIRRRARSQPPFLLIPLPRASIKDRGREKKMKQQKR